MYIQKNPKKKGLKGGDLIARFNRAMCLWLLFMAVVRVVDCCCAFGNCGIIWMGMCCTGICTTVAFFIKMELLVSSMSEDFLAGPPN
jgi:hypothetical protein